MGSRELQHGAVASLGPPLPSRASQPPSFFPAFLHPRAALAEGCWQCSARCSPSRWPLQRSHRPRSGRALSGMLSPPPPACGPNPDQAAGRGREGRGAARGGYPALGEGTGQHRPEPTGQFPPRRQGQDTAGGGIPGWAFGGLGKTARGKGGEQQLRGEHVGAVMAFGSSDIWRR